MFKTYKLGVPNTFLQCRPTLFLSLQQVCKLIKKNLNLNNFTSSFLKRQKEEGVGVEVGYFAASLAELTAGQPRVQVTLCREAEAAGLAVDAREAVPTFAHRTHVALHAGPLQKTHTSKIQTTVMPTVPEKITAVKQQLGHG